MLKFCGHNNKTSLSLTNKKSCILFTQHGFTNMVPTEVNVFACSAPCLFVHFVISSFAYTVHKYHALLTYYRQTLMDIGKIYNCEFAGFLPPE